MHRGRVEKMNWLIFKDYSFLVVAIGTVLLGVASGIVGSVSVLKGQSLIGDAVGHASFPGIILFFMLFLTRNPLVLMAGAVVSGLLAYFVIQSLDRHSSTSRDAVLAIVLSSFFGLGMVLKSYIQGNAKFSGASQSGLQNYIFGQAAYMMKSDIYAIFIVSVASIATIVLFFKEIQLYVFDEQYGETMGFRRTRISFVILLMIIALIAVGLKAVGAILISSMLIAPSVAGLQWSHRYRTVLLISGFFGGLSSFIGTYISATGRGFSTGPSIVLVMSLMALLSILFAPNGLLRSRRKRKRGMSNE